jgi:hypothetical protein
VSCSLHDSIELESKGIPTVTICTEGFIDAATRQAATRGMPELPIVGIPFPFAALRPEQARARGFEAFESIVAGLTGAGNR